MPKGVGDIDRVGLVKSLGLLCAMAAGGCSCGAPCLEEPTPIPDAGWRGYESAKYADPAAWLCRGDVNDDSCDVELRATEVLPDGGTAVVEHVTLDAPAVDCFYVYPTVDLGLSPGIHDDPRAEGAIAAVAETQAARFSETCAVWAPLYRQVKLGAYNPRVDEDDRERCFAIAQSDVRDAFLHFLGSLSNDRPFVVFGHSQGTHHLMSVLRDLVDPDADLRARMVAALLVGGSVSVDEGGVAGGTFTNLPLCERADDTGCVIAFRSYVDGTEDPEVSGASLLPAFALHEGDVLACNGPDARGDAARPLSRSFLRKSALYDLPDVDTDFVLYRGRYTAGCATAANEMRFLGVSLTEGDARPDPIDVGADRWQGVTGLHILDVQLAMGDLLDTVAARVAAFE